MTCMPEKMPIPIRPGEIWAVAGPDPAARSRWCAGVAREGGDGAALLNFAQQASEARKTGWSQARYYMAEGRTVEEFLSFDSVYGVNPFEVGARYPETRAAYRRRLAAICGLLELRGIKDRFVMALSNGETRRVLLARALARRPGLLVLDDPAGGLDARQRARMREAIGTLAKDGLAVIFAYRHEDELPGGVARWFRIGAGGKLREVAPPYGSKADAALPARPHAGPRNPGNAGEPVVEIRNLDATVGGTRLFKGLSWTVRRGERWVLRGGNGSGKTTLLALITGDSPMAYAADVRVFGIPREVGTELAAIRRRTGIVSPELQAHLGLGPKELLDRALTPRHKLLLLDEPFMNLDADEARREGRRIERFLRANRDVAAILVCHRRDEAPRLFDREFDLDGSAA